MIINEITEITKRIENIDGEDLYVIDGNMKKGIDMMKEIINAQKDSYVLSMLEKDINFICRHSDFAIAFRNIELSSMDWLPCLIYKYKGEWRRVLLEYANCTKCDWIGLVADPTNSELYFTLENQFEVMRNINKLSFGNCPKCGNGISRKAIWIDENR